MRVCHMKNRVTSDILGVRVGMTLDKSAIKWNWWNCICLVYNNENTFENEIVRYELRYNLQAFYKSSFIHIQY